LSAVSVPQRPLHHRARRWFGDYVIRLYAVVAFAYLFLPIAWTIAFSFNDGGKTNLTWQGFTVRNWQNPCEAAEFCSALGNSLKIGLLSTAGSVVLGTMVAFALARHRFYGRRATNLLIFLPMATAEVVMGASLLALFLSIGVPLGFWTIVMAHVLFSLSFVVVTVKARIASLDPRLEQAAMDLYANEVQTFLRVTLPLVAPGIFGAALLAFSLSFDDFIITNFNRGAETTFPVQVYVAAQRGIPPQANVIGTAMFLLALVVVLLAQLLRPRRAS
jgi:spermidine/putrescine transport system permease protein